MTELEQMLSETPTGWTTARDLSQETARAALERLPRLYVRLARRRNPHRPLLDRSTDVVIEGFPRSGNTFLLAWITLANPQLEVASHLHRVAHIQVALRQGTPVIVLLRSPDDALASEFINRAGRGEAMNLPQLFKRYEYFYQSASRYTNDVIISPFETTTKHPNRVIRALSQRIGRPLALAPSPQEDEVLAEVERLNTLHAGEPNELTVARPSDSRGELAADIKSYLAENHASTLTRLQDLHDALAASSSAIRPAGASD